MIRFPIFTSVFSSGPMAQAAIVQYLPVCGWSHSRTGWTIAFPLAGPIPVQYVM